MDEPRIAFVTPSFRPEIGGAETYTANLLAELGMTCPVDVVAASVRGLEAEHVAPGALVHRVGRAGRRGALRAIALAGASRDALEALRPDVVLAQYSGLLPASRYARSAGVPLVALVHDLWGFRESLRWRGPSGPARFLGNDRLLAVARPDVVIAVSEATAAAVRRLIDAPVVVARPGADHVPDGPLPEVGSRTVLFVGRLIRSKGVGELGAAMGQVRRELPSAGLRLVGSGPERSHVPGWARVDAELDPAGLDAAFRSSALVALPSWREGWGLVLTEATARGVPYVAFDIPAVREQHALIGGGLLVPAGDERALARAIADLLRDPVRRAALGEAGQAAVRARLTWRSAAEAVRGAIGWARRGRDLATNAAAGVST